MYSESRRHLLYSTNINRTARPKLAKVLDSYKGKAYLLSGKLSKSKIKDTDRLIIMINDDYNKYMIIEDLPAIKSEDISEKYYKININTQGREILNNIVMEMVGVEKPKRKESTGRKPKSDEFIQQIKKSREQGVSIRHIADDLHVSTATVQKYIKI